MSNVQPATTGIEPVGNVALASRKLRLSVSALLLALLLSLGALSATAATSATPPVADEVWITVGADVFASAARKLAPLPGLAGGVVLERVDEHDGVVLTRIPRPAIDTLSELIHEEFRSCGGFVKHESLEEARETLARLRAPRRELGALPFSIDQPAMVSALAGQVSAAQILATITSLSTNFANRYHAHPSGSASAAWIKTLWEGYAVGHPGVTVAFFDHASITPQDSVILTIPGSTLPNEYVVLGGHQDSIRSGCSSNASCVAPGADDDASGIAVLSEVIRIALANGFQPQRTVQFMAYAAEEVGLEGSDHIAATYLSQARNVVAVLQQDMTGYFGSTNDVYIYTSHTDSELNGFVGDLLDAYQPGLLWGTSACSYACSDHASWNSRGYRAAFAFEAQFGQHNPQIHTSSDTVETIGNSAAHAAKFARLATAFMVEAAVDGVVVPDMPFLDGFESHDTSAWSSTTP